MHMLNLQYTVHSTRNERTATDMIPHKVPDSKASSNYGRPICTQIDLHTNVAQLREKLASQLKNFSLKKIQGCPMNMGTLWKSAFHSWRMPYDLVL